MGLNAYFAFTIVPELDGDWQLALGAVFVSGLLFSAMSLTSIRAWLVNSISMNLKIGIAAGIGLFLALIGLQDAGIVSADPETLVTLGDLSKPQTLLAAVGFLAIAALAVRKVTGAIIIGVLAVTAIAVIRLGFIAYIALKAAAGRFQDINAAVAVIAAAFLLKLVFA